MKLGDKYQAVRDIADAICEEQVTPEQITELEQLLEGNPEARRFYIDYIGIHSYLSSAVESNMEFVYRRIQTAEEFIVRPSGEMTSQHVELNETELSQTGLSQTDINQTGLNDAELIESNQTSPEQNQPPEKPLWSSFQITGLIAVLCLLAAMLMWFIVKQESNHYTAEIIDGRLSVINLGKIDNYYLDMGEYEVKQDSRIKLANGVIIHLVKHSVFKLLSSHEVKLKRGALFINNMNVNNINVNNEAGNNLPGNYQTSDNIIVRGPNFSLHSNGSDLSLDLRADKPIVSSGDNTLLIPARWRPMHYWSFDTHTDRAIDSAGLAHGIVSYRATRTKGLVGAGAFHFDNSFDARINVGSGGGTVPATGSFSVTDGVTIEALVKPNFSGKIGDMDEIFRKDQSDKDLRMLLSFQQDKYHKSYLKPTGLYKDKETLSFGLFLLGQGYEELKLPLDGIDGRPTLAQLKDGNRHHIVATYNVKTGLKAIYVDGIQHVSFQYPPGSKMLSGGAGTANIGNSPNASTPVKPTDVRYADNEAFSGIIDEVAFYNFSLPSYRVKQHYENIVQKYNYFGLLPGTEVLPENIELKLPAQSTVVIEPLTGLPDSVSKR